MQVKITKKTNHQCEYLITRDDQSVERITLETKTYLLHDICHFVVEKNLEYPKGFWGMLAQGYTFNSLFGKANPQTTELRFIEQIIGPIQSVYSGHIAEHHFSQTIAHLDFILPEETLSVCLTEIKGIMEEWEQLRLEQHLTLEWNFEKQPIVYLNN